MQEDTMCEQFIIPQPISAQSDLQQAIHILEHAKRAAVEELAEVQEALTSLRDLLLGGASKPGILPTFEVGITEATSMWLAELDARRRGRRPAARFSADVRTKILRARKPARMVAA
jgi:plasmid stabilization system protein ParE